jgi:hypothetical protein
MYNIVKNYSKEELIMAKKKTYTVKGHRQLQREKEQIRDLVESDCEARIKHLKKTVISLFPGLRSEQVQAALSAGLDVELNTKVSAQALMDILRS